MFNITPDNFAIKMLAGTGRRAHALGPIPFSPTFQVFSGFQAAIKSTSIPQIS